MVCTDLPATGQNSNTLKSKDWAILATKHTHQNWLKSSPGQLPPANYIWFSPLTSRLHSFGHKSTPSDWPWI